MLLENIPIQQKLMAIILSACATVLLIACTIYYVYELFTLRKAMVRQITLMGEIIAANSTAALAFDSPDEAYEILSALQAEEHIVAACLYDAEGNLFTWYPQDLNIKSFPKVSEVTGYEFDDSYLSGFQSVLQDERHLGTLFLKSDLGILEEQSRLFGMIILLVIILSFGLAYLVSKVSQKVIAKPILTLVKTAQTVSDRQDYSVRAPKAGKDETGLLTNAFNNMLEMIWRQNNVLIESSERIRLIIDSSLNAIVVMNEAGLITDWNVSAEKMFGWRRDEVIGLDMANKIIPDEFRKAHLAGVKKFLSTGDSKFIDNQIEIKALRKHGEIFPIELLIRVLTIGGERAFCGFITDITERKMAEEELKKGKILLEKIVQSMGDAYVSLDGKWRYTYVNDKALALMGKSREELLGKTIWNVFPDTIGTVFDTEYHKVMQKRTPVSFETHYSLYDIWLEVRAYPNEDGMAIFYTDISKFKKAEEDMRLFNQVLEQKVKKRTKELEVANRELESFSYSVSHDLRAPLRAINGYINIFSEDYADRFDEEGKLILKTVIRNSKKMGMLIDDLLEFSRLGRKELVKSKISMMRTVEEIIDELTKTENNRQIEFKVEKLPAVYADSTAIRQVWINLISNAIKYTRGKEKAVIEIGADKKNKGSVFYIRDNGAGFDMKYYQKLFGVFQRLHSMDEFEGTGVGLAIVYRIIDKHHGKIWAEAKPNEGATFYFTLHK